MTFNFREELGKMTPKIAQGAKVYVFGTGGLWNHISRDRGTSVEYIADVVRKCCNV